MVGLRVNSVSPEDPLDADFSDNSFETGEVLKISVFGGNLWSLR